MTPIEKWLFDATRGLSAESASQVRAEIQQHYDSACEAGGDAIAALGDPRTANRAYRKVLLTEQEAMLAPFLTRPKRPSLPNMLLRSALLTAFAWWLARQYHGPGSWPILIVIFCTTPLSWFFPLTTLERSYVYVYVHGVRSILVVAVAWWYQSWIGALSLGAVVFCSTISSAIVACRSSASWPQAKRKACFPRSPG